MSKGELITIPHMNEKSQYYCSEGFSTTDIAEQ